MPSSVDIAGALAAIEARLTANWTATPVLLQNKQPPDGEEWPPVASDSSPVPWVYCELIDVDANIVGFGTPGNQTICDEGLIKLSVMVRKGSGLDIARQHATALGELFRQQKFFDTDPTAHVRSYTPRVGQGDMVSEDGNQISACCTIAYEFFHRA